MKTTIPLLAIGVAVAACRQPAKPVETITADAPATMHAVHNERLVGIMERLAMLPVERLPQELDVEQEQRWRRGDAVRVLGEMAAAADGIPAVLTRSDLSAGERRVFRGLAGNLKAAAEELQKEVPKLAPVEIGRRFNSLQAHCDACHGRFRGLPQLE